jgi:hypothetical protein
MSALGEDPAQFEAERQALLASYGPGDELWYRQLDDLARLYWRRSRLERAQGALVHRSLTPSPLGRGPGAVVGNEAGMSMKTNGHHQETKTLRRSRL